MGSLPLEARYGSIDQLLMESLVSLRERIDRKFTNDKDMTAVNVPPAIHEQGSRRREESRIKVARGTEKGRFSQHFHVRTNFIGLCAGAKARITLFRES